MAPVNRPMPSSTSPKGGNALPPNSIVTWKGTLTRSHAGNYWIYLQALGTNASISSLTASAWRAPAHSRAAFTATFCKPTRTTPSPPPTASTMFAAPVDSPPGRTPSKSTPARHLQLRLCRFASTGTRPSSAKPTTKPPSPRQRMPKSLSSSSGRASIPSSASPAIRTSSSKKSPQSIPTPSSCSTPASPSPCPGSTRSKPFSKCGGPATKAAGPPPTPARQNQPRRPPARHLGQEPHRLPCHRSQASRALVKGVDGKTTYSEGVNVGYRWFDKENIEPLFAFGHGLSYTTFDYSGLKVKKASDGGLDVPVDQEHRQLGSDEVPQVYLGAPSEVPAESSSLSAPWSPSTASTLLQAQPRPHASRPAAPIAVLVHGESEWVAATGKRIVSVGSSSRDLRLNQTIN